MKHGFKAYAKRLSIAVRAEVGLDAFSSFDPYALADAYGVQVYDIADVGCSPAAVARFTTIRSSVWSGALVPTPDGLVIVENSAHLLDVVAEISLVADIDRITFAPFDVLGYILSANAR